MLKLSKRCRFQEWSLCVISMMDPWALWHNPVIRFGRKTYCDRIMQRFSHPWPFSFSSLGFSVIYSLESMCAWWCIHCPSGVGPGCQFYHFIFSSIIKLLYWVRQHGKFILFSLPRTITSSYALQYRNSRSSCFCVKIPKQHILNVAPLWLVLDITAHSIQHFSIIYHYKNGIWMEVIRCVGLNVPWQQLVLLTVF